MGPNTASSTAAIPWNDVAEPGNNFIAEKPAEDETCVLSNKRPPAGSGIASAKRPKASSKVETWSETTHRMFVETIYDIGVKNASPSVIMENMTEQHEAVTSERVKSHLQKYRNNREKSKQEFLAEYDSWMQKALTVGAAGASELVPPSTIVNMMASGKLVGGDLAGFLTYSAMFDENYEINGQSDITAVQSRDFNNLTGARVPFPVLTEEERKSPLGVSISHVISLFYSMTQYIMQERKIRGDDKLEEQEQEDGVDSSGERLLGEGFESEEQKEEESQRNMSGAYEDYGCGQDYRITGNRSENFG